MSMALCTVEAESFTYHLKGYWFDPWLTLKCGCKFYCCKKKTFNIWLIVKSAIFGAKPQSPVVSCNCTNSDISY